jgi:hypothetical protein
MRGSGAQKLSSFRRRIRLWKLMPQVCSSALLNRSVRNGIAISAYHPASVMRAYTSHSASHFSMTSSPS